MKTHPSSPRFPHAPWLLALAVACGFLFSARFALAVTNYFDTVPGTAALDGGAGNWADADWKATSNATSGAAWTTGNDAWFQPNAPLTNNLGGNTYTNGTFYSVSTLGMIVLTNGSLVMDKIVATGNSNLTLNLASVSIGAGGISNSNTGSKVLNLGSNATLTATQTWIYGASSGNLTINGQVNLGAMPLRNCGA